MNYKVPILFQFYNNLDTTIRVFQEIRKVQPSQLFLVQDKYRPNFPSENEECLMVRKAVLDMIDWECSLVTHFRESNLGPGKGTAEAIIWFFRQVEYGIVFEHDCLPHPDFFEYCEILLEKYKNNERVKVISGANFKGNKEYGRSSYYFGTVGHFWGWASWRRTFVNYIQDIENISVEETKKSISENFKEKRLQDYWAKTVYWLKEKEVDTWDYQLFYMLWKQRGLIILPNANLISNIGFGEKALNCTGTDSPFSNAPTNSILPLEHPIIVRRNYKADVNYCDYLYYLTGTSNLINDLFWRAKNLFRKIGYRVICFFVPEIKNLRSNSALGLLKSSEENGLISSRSLLNHPYHFKESSIGDYSYVSINSNISFTRIGKFCSIGPNFISGWGIHPTDGLSTSPMFYSTNKQNGLTFSKENKVDEHKNISIGNDVFIGANVIILDGITIGDGAIIGAGAVVSKNIPPYAIAVGCPIKIIKYRFDDSKIDELLRIKWWEFPTDKLQEVEKMFFDVNSFIEKYGNKKIFNNNSKPE
jgi:acetyltransferase-like isoleucine patch superfamily enzyme